MKRKEIYILIGAAVLIAAFVWWGSAGERVEDDVQAPGTTAVAPGTKSAKPGSPASRLPSSVNPTVTAEKPVPVVPTAQSLAGSTFRLASYNGAPLPADTKFTLTFTETTFSLKLCNTLSGGYYISNTLFKTPNVISTQMYCSYPTNIMKIEADVSLMLNSDLTNIYRSGSTLIFSHNSGIVLGFEGF